ncbi:hypothetical protein TVAG_340470 [Trichomonas vaginalis G3]|uniref:Uncharacterized protein n=1 Tax=Trichomonas vaginalis (strain ATCC PRA-98 / G3) TaxID=412133 RepID=A2EKG1_TRIV3|nr:hypothetical protein TVAGG3_0979600 [Trichomonas vaginalis G3]EAY06869.1 hypothetical protein TVAG_340470 [Trichomonas vaginalis G3]KAI5489187.1 hypothetical protein TVAGG3_0979600 [Trichomonas vaginalis G3]|eukprot:XP_001319092.1 hypothetical protein [Trichomonas vaginalis G3]
MNDKIIQPRRGRSAMHAMTAPQSTLGSPRGRNIRTAKGIRLSFDLTGLMQNTLNPDGEDTLAVIKPVFRQFIEKISDFLNHTGGTKAIRDDLQGITLKTDELFSTFYSQLTKSGRSAIPISKIKTISLTTMSVKSSAIPFALIWQRIIKHINRIKETGEKLILDSINDNFNIVLNSLDSIINSNGYNAGMHDNNIKKARKFQQVVWNLQRKVQDFFNIINVEKKYHEKAITDELKVLSRDISAAYTNDFSKIAAVFSENENSRNKIYTCICEVVFQLHSLTIFSEDVLAISNAYTDVDQYINVIVDSLQIRDKLNETSPEEEEEEIPRNTTNSLKKSIIDSEGEYFLVDMELPEIVHRASIAFKRGITDRKRFDEFMSVLRKKSDLVTNEIKTCKDTLQEQAPKIASYDEMEKSLQEATKEITEFKTQSFIQKQTIKDLKDKLNEMTNNTNVNGLRSCLNDVCTVLSNNTEEIKANGSNDDAIIETTRQLLEVAAKNKCLSCQQNEEVFKSLKQLLGSEMYVEEVQILIRKYNELSNHYTSQSDKISELTEEIKTLRESLYAIIGEFKLSLPDEKNLPTFSVMCVKEQLAILNNKFEAEKVHHSKDIVAITQMIKKSFNLAENTSLESDIENLQKAFHSIQNEMITQSKFLKTVEERLKALTRTSATPKSIMDSIDQMLSLVENTENPLEPLVKTLRRTIAESKKCINVIEPKIQDLTGISLVINQDLGIDQRLANISANLETFFANQS